MNAVKAISKRIGLRLTYLIPVILIGLFINYYFVRLMPGDPVKIYLGQDAYSKAVINGELGRWEEYLGVNQHVTIQYFKWLGRALTGDLGVTLQTQESVTQFLKTPLKNTIYLNLMAFTISFVLSIVIGVKQAVNKGGRFDNAAGVATLAGVSIPSFATAMILIFIVAIKLRWLPYYGMFDPTDTDTPMWLNRLKHLILPMTTILIGSLASISRYMRTAMISSLSQDYIRTARAKGLAEWKVVWKHGFRNALVPVVTILGGFLPALFAGSIITETIFGWNGVGTKLINAIHGRDVNVIMASTALFLSMTLISYILVDIMYGVVDPRMRR